MGCLYPGGEQSSIQPKQAMQRVNGNNLLAGKGGGVIAGNDRSRWGRRGSRFAGT